MAARERLDIHFKLILTNESVNLLLSSQFTGLIDILSHDRLLFSPVVRQLYIVSLVYFNLINVETKKIINFSNIHCVNELRILFKLFMIFAIIEFLLCNRFIS